MSSREMYTKLTESKVSNKESVLQYWGSVLKLLMAACYHRGAETEAGAAVSSPTDNCCNTLT